ncbi:hypothetical protein JW916_12660 [Candidatus Sumerlaeota bacterium]|nr:hypothetical protein [Candidatus Sumerlaeota bacterium]
MKVYSSFSPPTLSGELASKSGTLSDAGIYSIYLDSPMVVTEGETRVLFLDISFPYIGSNMYVVPKSWTPTNQTAKCYYRKEETYAWTDASVGGYPFDLVLRGRIYAPPPVPTPTPTPEPLRAESWTLFE